jgi:uncharacterized protein (DUF488 family)
LRDKPHCRGKEEKEEGMIFTIGYSGWKPQELASIAASLRAIVIDVRYSPRSRVPHWNQAALIRLLGDRYMHVPALGNRNYRTGGPISLANPDEGVAVVNAVMSAGHAVILMCMCKNVETCHRRVAAELLATKLGYPVQHVFRPVWPMPLMFLEGFVRLSSPSTTRYGITAT